MKVDHKKRRGEGLRVSGFGGGGVCGLSLVGRRQASTDKLEFLGALVVGGVGGLGWFRFQVGI